MSKQKFHSSYIQFQFTSIIHGRQEKGQYVLCNKVLGQHSLRPSKLKLHPEKVHLDDKDKDLNFFKRREEFEAPALGCRRLFSTTFSEPR